MALTLGTFESGLIQGDWGLGEELLWSLVLPLGAYFLVNGYLLAVRGQTVGKIMLGVRIVNLDGSLASFARVGGVRFALIELIGMAPLVGQLFYLVDALFIFRSDHRCIHDHMAGTKVVTA